MQIKKNFLNTKHVCEFYYIVQISTLIEKK